MNSEFYSDPHVIVGDLAIDDRGEVGFVNDFAFVGVKRFYTVSNHRANLIRAWHGHRHEAKYVTVTHGAALVAAVRIDNWDKPSTDLPLFRAVLSSRKPSVIFIPAGFANGFMSLTDGAQLMFFSTVALQEGAADDIRFEAKFWNPWDVLER